MNGEIAAAAVAVLINAAFIGGNLAVHRWESRRSRFVERRRELGNPPILGSFGYRSGRYGNPIALTAINVGVVDAPGAASFRAVDGPVCRNRPSSRGRLLPFATGPAAAAGYFFHCKQIGKIDWTFLGDRLTVGGQLHLVYIAVEVAASVLGIGLAVANGLNPPLLTAVAGGALYLCLVGLDIRADRHRRPGPPPFA